MSKMISLPHVASLVYNTPLMITDAKLQTIMSFLTPRLYGGDLITAAQMREHEDRVVEVMPEVVPDEKTLRVVPIEGVLMNKVRGLDAFSGMTSYEDIVSAVRESTDDPTVVATILLVDSPGGMVTGAFDAADAIFQMNSVKPIYTVVNGEANSAAYALASGTSKIYLSRTDIVGSIGVRTQHVDVSELNAKLGVKYTDIFAGTHKVDGSPNSPLPDEVKAEMQAQIDSVMAIFADTVARNRSLSVSEVLDTEAAIYAGEAAVLAGLADAVLSVEEAFDDIIQISTRSNASMKTQAIPTEANAGGAPVSLEAPTAPSIPVADATAQSAEAVVTAVEGERDRISKIYALPEAEGQSAMCAKAVAMGLSVEDTKELLASVTVPEPAPAAHVSPLDVAMEGVENPQIGADAPTESQVDEEDTVVAQIASFANVVSLNAE